MSAVGLRNVETLARFQAQARVLKALAHPTRLFIVEELSRQKRSVSELSDLVGAQMSTVSKHLSQLKHVGLVDDEKHGSQVFYRLKTHCAMRFFQCLESVQESKDRAWYQPA